MNKVGVNDWIKAVQKHGFIVTTNGGSHRAIRKPDIPNSDIRGLIQTVYDGMSKQVKIKVFKALVKAGMEEDFLWKELNLL